MKYIRKYESVNLPSDIDSKLEKIKKMGQKSTDINILNEDGSLDFKTNSFILRTFVRYGDLDMVKYCLEQGSDPNKDDGMSFDWAIYWMHTTNKNDEYEFDTKLEILKLLIPHMDKEKIKYGIDIIKNNKYVKAFLTALNLLENSK